MSPPVPGELVSSLRIVPMADAVPNVAPALGFDSVTVNPSLTSITVSDATLTVIVFDVSPAAKLTVPLGSTLPEKSEADAGLAPLPVRDHDTLCAAPVSPVRVTVKVNGVVPEFPSALSAASAEIAKATGPPSPFRSWWKAVSRSWIDGSDPGTTPVA